MACLRASSAKRCAIRTWSAAWRTRAAWIWGPRLLCREAHPAGPQDRGSAHAGQYAGRGHHVQIDGSYCRQLRQLFDPTGQCQRPSAAWRCAYEFKGTTNRAQRTAGQRQSVSPGDGGSSPRSRIDCCSGCAASCVLEQRSAPTSLAQGARPRQVAHESQVATALFIAP